MCARYFRGILGSARERAPADDDDTTKTTTTKAWGGFDWEEPR